MKNLFLIILLFVCFTGTYAQIGIKANNTPPIASAQLEVQSTNKAFYPPRMTTLQKGNISSPQAGAVVYDTDLGALNFYNGSAWLSASGAALSLPYSADQVINSGSLFEINNSSLISGGGSTSIYGYNNNGVGIKGLSTYGLGGSFDSGFGTAGVFNSGFGYSIVTSGKLRFGGNGVGTLATGKFLKSTNASGDAQWGELVPYTNSQNSAEIGRAHV